MIKIVRNNLSCAKKYMVTISGALAQWWKHWYLYSNGAHPLLWWLVIFWSKYQDFFSDYRFHLKAQNRILRLRIQSNQDYDYYLKSILAYFWKRCFPVSSFTSNRPESSSWWGAFYWTQRETMDTLSYVDQSCNKTVGLFS